MSIESNILRLQNIISVNTEKIEQNNIRISDLSENVIRLENSITSELNGKEYDNILDDIQKLNTEIINLQQANIDL